jgi:hypothetical protein
MTATILILPVVRIERRPPPPDSIIPTRMRIAVDLSLTPARWERLERIAKDSSTNLNCSIAGIVSSYLDAEAEEDGEA